MSSASEGLGWDPVSDLACFPKAATHTGNLHSHGFQKWLFWGRNRTAWGKQNTGRKLLTTVRPRLFWLFFLSFPFLSSVFIKSYFLLSPLEKTEQIALNVTTSYPRNVPRQWAAFHVVILRPRSYRLASLQYCLDSDSLLVPFHTSRVQEEGPEPSDVTFQQSKLSQTDTTGLKEANEVIRSLCPEGKENTNSQQFLWQPWRYGSHHHNETIFMILPNYTSDFDSTQFP